MDLGMRDTLLYDSMHCTTAVSLEMSDEPYIICIALYRVDIIKVHSPAPTTSQIAPFTLLCDIIGSNTIQTPLECNANVTRL